MKLKPSQYIGKYAKYAMISQYIYGIPASIILAQSILESGWGGSGLSTIGNAFFGIKADNSWKGKVYNGATHEFYNGTRIELIDGFRAYKNPLASFRDHAKFLKENNRYQSLFNIEETNYTDWAIGLKSAGYATSPTYSQKLISLVEQYDLNKFDKKVRNIKTLSIIISIGLIIGLIALYRKIKV